jgi:hypothetical protein
MLVGPFCSNYLCKLRDGVAVICRVSARGVVFELAFDVVQQAAGAEAE